jgi:hypothetical protein
MMKTLVLSGKRSYSTAAAVKALAVFLVMSIFVNALVPKFAIDANDYSTLCQIMKSQTALLEFFSFSTLPIKIVDRLFNEQGAASSASHKKAPKDDANNASNTASDFSITSNTFKDVSRFLSKCGAGFGCGGALAVFAGNLRASPGTGPCPGSVPVVPLVIIILLMFYFLKARSALPDAAIIMPIAETISRFAVANRDFSLPVHTNSVSNCVANSLLSFRKALIRNPEQCIFYIYIYKINNEMDPGLNNSGMTPGGYIYPQGRLL